MEQQHQAFAGIERFTIKAHTVRFDMHIGTTGLLSVDVHEPHANQLANFSSRAVPAIRKQLIETYHVEPSAL
jgi:hypothetical protein